MSRWNVLFLINDIQALVRTLGNVYKNLKVRSRGSEKRKSKETEVLAHSPKASAEDKPLIVVFEFCCDHHEVTVKCQERFGNMTRVYYREAMGAFIVFDVTQPSTFEAVTKWKEDLDAKLSLSNGKHVAAVLLANKCDQGRDVLTNNGIKMEQFCQENGFVGWFETSAKENINIDEAAHCLVKHIIANENDLLQSEVAETISPQQESSRGGTCSACFRS
ncbi:ras-related protein Rab-38-like isoform X2 [Sinocyclocheilus grahami]|uniref:ras-related protein Rab-38-like isoform X1 n=1 Tax=Sinocyclocheilus grahami TaxID=75366 RepID=UPI0007AC90D0|nr:PREDICTED: ras-related protein Rab-38-like isoform X1 [Sinocyclocheilus grahami]XP_016098025.1 PREDICTED: ras-related protein Rab-38-like isoform X2 [Sinocyclocheilus grahami]